MVKNKFPILCAFGNGAIVPLGQVIVKEDFHVVFETGGVFAAGFVHLVQEPYRHTQVGRGLRTFDELPRLLGVAAALQGQRVTAEAHFNTAISLATEAQAAPELARTCLDYARLAVAQHTPGHYQHAAACLQQAQRLFHIYRMDAFAQQALQLLPHRQRVVPVLPEARHLLANGQQEVESGVFFPGH